MSLKSKLAQKLQVDHPTQEPQKINDTRKIRFSRKLGQADPRARVISDSLSETRESQKEKSLSETRDSISESLAESRDSKYKKEKVEVNEREAKAIRKLMVIRKNEPAARKIIKASKQLADYITDRDTEESVQVLREAKQATTYVYSKEEGAMVPVPDFRTRLAATTLERAYAEGTPVQRQIVLTGKFDTDDAIMDKVAGGQEALKAIETLSRLGIKVDYQRETPGNVIEAETFQSDEDSGDD